MKVSNLVFKTKKESSDQEKSINHQLLVRGGFVDQLMAGVYHFLPLGMRTLRNIENIVREEMVGAGGVELLMPTLHPAENWKQTKRWQEMDDLYRFTSYYSKKELALGPTHEEVLAPLMKKFANSYKDFPFAIFQIQTKFRDEKRAKSGLLRGREFLMKDLYSFHTSEQDLEQYYENMKKVYKRIFERTGIAEKTYMTYAGGGSFSKYSHEYQTVTEAGEDIIYICDKCKVAVNKEIIKDLKNSCPECGNNKLREEKSIEVGNIFILKDKFSSAFNYTFADESGKQKPVLMGCYGIGINRLMGTIVEIHNDDKGIVWPEAVAPVLVYLIGLPGAEKETLEIYNNLTKAGVEVLWDDRDTSAGAKFGDADLLGIPKRVVISPKTLAQNSAELKHRGNGKIELVKLSELIKKI